MKGVLKRGCSRRRRERDAREEKRMLGKRRLPRITAGVFPGV